MANGELLKALCPSPDEWRDMETKDFQERVGKCLGYLLERDQVRTEVKPNTKVNAGAAFVGGIIGGASTVLGYLGLKG